MRILIITHDILTYEQSKKKMRWTRFPMHFAQLGHKVKYIRKYFWWTYPIHYFLFRPDVVISVGKTAGLITALHHLMTFGRKALFVHDLTDYYKIYKSPQRMRFLRQNHDLTTSPSYYNYTKFQCQEYIMNGSDYKPGKAKITYDACYQGAQNDFYNLKKLKKECKAKGISFYNIQGFTSEQVEKEMYKAKVCVYSLSWDSSLKTTDYAAIAKPVVVIKPNLLEKIKYPAYYTSDLTQGIKYLLTHPKEADKLGKKARLWFIEHSGSWKEQAVKYLKILKKYKRGKK